MIFDLKTTTMQTIIIITMLRLKEHCTKLRCKMLKTNQYLEPEKLTAHCQILLNHYINLNLTLTRYSI